MFDLFASGIGSLARNLELFATFDMFEMANVCLLNLIVVAARLVRLYFQVALLLLNIVRLKFQALPLTCTCKFGVSFGLITIKHAWFEENQ